MTVVLVHVKCRKKLKAVRGSYLPFVIKHELFPLGTTSLLVSCSGLWRVCVQTFVKQANFYHISLVAWHYIKQGFIFLWSFFNFLELKCHGTPCMCPCRDTTIFENAFYFTAHGINSHTSTPIWFFKPLWLAVACRCSSNLNYGH
jgi:hypothetical protein